MIGEIDTIYPRLLPEALMVRWQYNATQITGKVQEDFDQLMNRLGERITTVRHGLTTIQTVAPLFSEDVLSQKCWVRIINCTILGEDAAKIRTLCNLQVEAILNQLQGEALSHYDKLWYEIMALRMQKRYELCENIVQKSLELNQLCALIFEPHGIFLEKGNQQISRLNIVQDR